MRIAIDVQSTLGEKTGIGQYTTHLLNTLRQVAPQHEYIPLSLGRDVIMRTDRRMIWQQIRLPLAARSARADLLHVPGFDAPRWKPVPVVYTVMDLIGQLFPKNLPPVARLYWSLWLPRSIPWADRLIAISEHTRQDLNRLEGIETSKVTVIPLGVDSRFKPISEPTILATCRKTYNLPARFLLYIGTLEPRKGLDTLVSAYSQLAQRTGKDLPFLVIAGKKGWYTEALFKQVHAEGLEDRILFPGYIADQDLPALYNLAEVFVFPSRYEGFGLPPLEAMACGTPVVSSNTSSMPEVVGNAGFLVNAGESLALATAIESILEDEELRRKLVERGKERASRFTWEETARQTVQVYEELR